jgi:SET domain-containing protein
VRPSRRTIAGRQDKSNQPHIYWDHKIMMLVRTYLSNSKIEGVGIFAAEPAKAGDIIWRLEPEFDVLLTREQIASWPAHMDSFLEHYCYPHLHQPGVWVLEVDNGRFMNHSAFPNTDFSAFYYGKAIRDIAMGEEITCNYYEFDSDFRGQFPQIAYDRPEMRP